MKLSSKTISYLLIGSILMLGLIARLVFLSRYPPSLNWDEVSLGYNAYSILKTAKDEWGNLIPSLFRAYGDFKLPLYIYLSIPFISLFGLNPFSARLLSVIAGALLPLAIFLLSKSIFPKNRTLPYFSALFVALSPWSIFLSRVALEANLFATIFCFSLYFLYQKKFSLSLILCALSLFTYNSSRILLPFYFIAIIFKRPSRPHPVALLIFVSAICLLLYQTFFITSGQSRYKLVSLIDQGTINRIESRRSTLSPLIGKIVHNKITYFTVYSVQNYLKVIDPRFLFVSGSSNYQFNIPYSPLIYTFLFPFFFLGLYFLTKNNRSLLYWLLISPIPSAITRDAPHTLRAIIFLPLATIVIAYGFSLVKNKYLIILTLITLSICTLSYYKSLNIYSIKYSWSWQFGYKEVVGYIKNNYSKYSNFYITKKYGEPHEFLLFYWPWDPHTYQNDPLKKWDFHSDWYWVDSFDKFIFINDWEIKSVTANPLPNSLLITSPQNYPPNSSILKTIYFLNQTPGFEIVKL